MGHYSVMLNESIDCLGVKPDGIYIDCTAGGGGHSRKILEKITGNGMLISADMDSEAVLRVSENLSELPGSHKVIKANFADISGFSSDLGLFGKVDGILADLGTSMFQLKSGERGFSFMMNGPLDMRMDKDLPMTAADVLNTYPKDDLYRIFKEYGEERHASRISKEVAEYRKKNKFMNTEDFAGLIEDLAGGRRGKIHPATRCFQALRIEVNNELSNLEKFLGDALNTLKTGGRLVVISFHSLEDRIVKRFIKNKSKNCICSEQAVRCECGSDNAFVVPITRKAVKPSSEEVRENPPSRSSRLRACEKIRESV